MQDDIFIIKFLGSTLLKFFLSNSFLNKEKTMTRKEGIYYDDMQNSVLLSKPKVKAVGCFLNNL